MDQRRLEPVRERAQLIGCPAAAAPAHDYYAVRLVDPAGDLGDIFGTRRKLLARLQGCHTGESPSALATMTSCGSVK